MDVLLLLRCHKHTSHTHAV